jgi:hypothetical protein
MPAHIRKGLITGAPSFNSGGLGLSIGSRVGGIRHAIARRAPDSVPINSNTVNSDTASVYKIKDSDAVVGVVLVNTVTPSEPYLSGFSLFYDTGAPLKELFTNNLQTFILTFKVPVIQSAPPDEYTVVLTSGTSDKIETLFTKMETNKYNFLLPSISATISGTKNPFDAIELIYDGTNFVSGTNDGTKILLTITAQVTNATQFSDYVRPVLFGKTFNITLTADNTLVIPQTAAINCGTYTGA